MMIYLKDLITKYPECKKDSGKLRAYLYDLHPGRDDRKQADLLITVAESGFPEEIDGKQSIKYAHYKKYIDNLIQTTDLNYKQAEDGIKEWMNALSVKADGADSSGMTISPTHVHKYQKTVVQPTCKEMGYTKYWCDCGYEYNDSFKPKVECNYVVTDRKEATCTASGYVKSKCKWCDKEKNETIPMKSHDFDIWQVTSKPTCSKTGTRKRICKVCGKEETETIRTTEHKWSEWNELIHPLCETDGKAARVCSVCGKKEEKKLPATGHVYSEWQPSTNKKRKFERFCSNCGKYEYSNYDPEERKREEARVAEEKRKAEKKPITEIWEILAGLFILLSPLLSIILIFLGIVLIFSAHFLVGLICILVAGVIGNIY